MSNVCSIRVSKKGLDLVVKSIIASAYRVSIMYFIRPTSKGSCKNLVLIKIKWHYPL